MKITILGCGGSSGVPLIGGENGAGYWGACDPQNPKNYRTRSSIYIETRNTALLIDTSPDLRSQLLKNHINRVDALLYTHAHADHLHGIDDIRSLNYANNAALPLYADDTTMAEIRERFPYVFRPLQADAGFYKPSVTPNVITISEQFTVGDCSIQPFAQDHGYVQSVGYRIGAMAYSTDVKAFPTESEPYLYDLDVWIVDCLQMQPHPTHADYAQTLAWIEQFQPKRAILTHMNATLDYNSLIDQLPDGVEPAYDGMVIDL